MVLETLTAAGAITGGLTGATIAADEYNKFLENTSETPTQIQNKQKLSGILQVIAGSVLTGLTAAAEGATLLSPIGTFLSAGTIALGIREFIEGYVSNKEEEA
ncbi:hypothetical protein GF362_03300 [Candidatus Dojkabacteria bacterium]|nr:hypothetical protein [Candidatus Dojkabacteria bacterium]